MRLHYSLIVATALLGVALPARAGALADARCRAESGAMLTPVVELYTSEGCSSCPPADRWLQRLRADGIAPRQLTALAFHVDYWDYIGWKDRFASAAWSARQRETVRRYGGRTVYTPQVMVNGADDPGWRSGSLPQVSQVAGASLQLIGTPAPDGGWDVSLTGSSAAPAPLRLTLVLVQHGLASQVKSGENRGVRLEHDFVVRALAEQTVSEQDFTLRQHFAPRAELDLTNAAAVALAHDSDGKLLQSLTLPWCP